MSIGTGLGYAWALRMIPDSVEDDILTRCADLHV